MAIKSWFTFVSGLSSFLLGVFGVGKFIFWLYQVSSQREAFDMKTVVAAPLICIFLLGLGYVLLKVSKR